MVAMSDFTARVSACGGDSAGMQTVDGGAPAVNLAEPARDTHAHTGEINRADFAL